MMRGGISATGSVNYCKANNKCVAIEEKKKKERKI